MCVIASKNPPPPSFTVNSDPVERVTCFKLPGTDVSDDLRWDVHVDALCKKVASGLYFLK